MKKVMKALCLLLALLMVLSACGDSGNSSSAPSSSTPESSKVEDSSSPESSEASQGGEETPASDGYAFQEHKDEPVTLSIYVESPGTLWEKWGEDPVSRRITEQTGISFECVAPVTEDDTKLALLIASDDLPDIVTGSWSDKNWNAMLEQGMLANLEEVAETGAPKLFSELIHPELQEYVRQDDGTIRFLLGHWDSSESTQWFLDHDYLIKTNQPVVLMRQDYFSELDNQEITTPQEFMEACKAIKEKHPETVPFYTGGVTTTGPSYLLTLFGLGNYYVADDGTVSKSYRNPQYLEMYKWVNEMVREGLMTEESFVDSDVEKDAKSLAGSVAPMCGPLARLGRCPLTMPAPPIIP